jgi:hypothetical protein
VRHLARNQISGDSLHLKLAAHLPEQFPTSLYPPKKVSTFDQFSALAVTMIFANQPCQPLEEVMENFAELMQRLLEIQSGGRQRSPELIAEDERLMDGLQKKTLAGKPTPQEFLY